jgi:hypothetical protein
MGIKKLETSAEIEARLAKNRDAYRKTRRESSCTLISNETSQDRSIRDTFHETCIISRRDFQQHT